MEFKYLLCGLLGVVFLPSLAHSDVTLTTPSHHTKPIGEDHLLIVLTNMHHSHTYSHLGTNEKIMLVELLAAAEVDAVTHYIDTVGFSKFLLLIDGELTFQKNIIVFLKLSKKELYLMSYLEYYVTVLILIQQKHLLFLIII